MEQALLVHGAQGIHDGDQQFQGGVETDPAVRLLPQVFAEGDPFHVVHDTVAGAVGAEEVLDRDDARMLVEVGQGPGLFQEAIKPIVELFAGLASVDGQAHTIRGATGAITGQVFLDRQSELQILIPGEVGDPKAAMAQDPADTVATVEDPAQGERGRRVVLRRLPAAV